jgi:hypothetical protein
MWSRNNPHASIATRTSEGSARWSDRSPRSSLQLPVSMATGAT